MRTKYADACLLIALVVFGAAGAVRAVELSEYQVKAAMLYKLSKFIEWPQAAFADARTPFEICVYGRDDFGSALDGLSGKSLQGRQTVLRRIAHEDGALSGCQLVFVSASERYRLRAVLRRLSDAPRLTIGDREGFAREGGMIYLRTVDNKIRFVINLGVALQAGLKISAQLLQLATIVETDN